MQAKCVVTSFGDLSCLTCLININPRFSCNYKEYPTSYCSFTPKDQIEDQIVINNHRAKGNEKGRDLVRQSGKPYREVLTL